MSRRLRTISTPIEGLLVVERDPVGDARGWLERLYCPGELRDALGSATIAAVNRTRTARAGTIRGMHFQRSPHAEDKLVTCLRGQVLDVAVDLRRGSPTFLGWHAEILDGEGHRSLLIPKGFAHGFQSLVDGCEMLYLHTAPYAPESEGGLDALDPALAIGWPLPVTERSRRDLSHPAIDPSFPGIDP